ncbi:hypothetical protein H4R99_001514 [Coemansia sp. RSA 1722]|nr:hypothetical protein LPJ57_001102 [Coemansia sp. RSA 486]KAJ2238173.1 hypothetical protein IWW45_000362 [Coemansia sp. RSA 485]KAJ2600579.1 hypothetical protein GGF39_001697 [Coemansia sp. RSA 1721]KAJ2604894.1 hypothetical protein H4R99_001514 [Coemansia sp. RSA 1722]
MFEEISRGYLPENYYSDKLVYKRKPPALQASQYPNKIEVSAFRDYAILVKKTGAKLQDAFAWMSTHPYIMVHNTTQTAGVNVTPNIVVEAYESPETRAYAMIAFRVATTEDENTNRVMQAKGESRRGPCPAPVTGLLCRSGVNLQSVWQWLSLHRGRLAWLVEEPLISNTAVVRRAGMQYSTYDEFNTRRTRNLQSGREPSDVNLQQYLSRQLPVNRRRSRESMDSMLPVYEPPPPSIHHSIPEDIRAELEQINSEGAQVQPNENNMAEEAVAAEDSPVEESSQMLLPPPYGEVARQTEYGRSFTTHLANAIFGSSSGFVIQNAALLTTSSDSASRATPALTRGSAIASPSSSAHSLDICNSTSSSSSSDYDIGQCTGAIPMPCCSTSTTSQKMPGTNEQQDMMRYRGKLTRTFTQSMPTLDQILSNEDAIAAVEESRRRAIVTAAISSSAVARIAEQSVVEHMLLAGGEAAVQAEHEAAPVNTAENVVVRSTETLDIQPEVSGISFPSDAAANGGGRASGSSGLLRSINVHVRRSRLSAKTNPEYSSSGQKKSNWLTRLLNI